MDSPALVAALAAGAGAVVTLVLVAVVWTLTRRRRSRADLEAMLAAAQRECDLLRHRLDELSSARPARTSSDVLTGLVPEEPARADFVITRAGEPDDLDRVEAERPIEVPDRLVLSATLGEPLVKVVAFSHGVRRALSAESRNRIRFEMRREVRAARKRRRRLVKDYLRDTRARERANEGIA